MKCVALIPARQGSERVPGKNIKVLNGHPLLAYAVGSARESGVFQHITVVTDSINYAEIARQYGSASLIRPPHTATSEAPDILWVTWALNKLSTDGLDFDAFAIVRPTSPFRRGDVLAKALRILELDDLAESVRGVRAVKEHPMKMWNKQGKYMSPFLNFSHGSVPMHSTQLKNLPELLVQDGSVDVSRTSIVFEQERITGDIVVPLLSEAEFAVDINSALDWHVAEYLADRQLVQLPEVNLVE